MNPLVQSKNRSEGGLIQAPSSLLETLRSVRKFRILEYSGPPAGGNLADEKAHGVRIPDEDLGGFLALGVAQFPAAKANKGVTRLIIKGFGGPPLHFGRELVGEGIEDFEDIIHGI